MGYKDCQLAGSEIIKVCAPSPQRTFPIDACGPLKIVNDRLNKIVGEENGEGGQANKVSCPMPGGDSPELMP
jgi:hypothetical protein